MGNEGADNIREGLKKSEFISSLSLHLQKFFLFLIYILIIYDLRNHIDKFGAAALSEGLEHMRFLVNLRLNLQEFELNFLFHYFLLI